MELAHHLLNLYRNMKSALRVLLKKKTRLVEANCPFIDYPYQHTTKWSQTERMQFNQAWQKHGKDFYLISREIPTKSVKQVVEYYYYWKIIDSSDTTAVDQEEYNEDISIDQVCIHRALETLVSLVVLN